MRQLDIAGAWVHEPKVFPDGRGSFHEWFRRADFAEATGQASASPRPTARSRGAARCAACTSPTCRRARPSTSSACAARSSTSSWTSGSARPRSAVGGRTAGRRGPPRRLPLRGPRPRLPRADRRRHRGLPVLGRVRARPRARHQPARPGTGHRLAAGVEPLLSEKDAAAPTLAEAQRGACCRRTPTACLRRRAARALGGELRPPAPVR